MSITLGMLPALLKQASEEGRSAFGQGAENTRQAKEIALKKYLQQQGPAIAGQEQTAKNEANLETLNNPKLQEQVQQGGQVGVGDIHIGADPYARAMAGQMNQGPKQAKALHDIATKMYAPLSDQLSSARATLEQLDQGNASSDKLALINEARLAAGAGGSRAIKSIMDSLTGGKTANMQFQEAMNYINNTPNLPTMPAGMRNAIRESVFNRLPQLEQWSQQTAQQLSKQSASIAPNTDYAGIVNTYTQPTGTNLQDLKQRQQNYMQARQTMTPGGQVSQPAIANESPSTVDKLMGFFGKKTENAQQQMQQKQSPQPGAMSFDEWKKANGR